RFHRRDAGRHVSHAGGAARHGGRDAAPAAHPRQAARQGSDVHRPCADGAGGACRGPGRAHYWRPRGGEGEDWRGNPESAGAGAETGKEDHRPRGRAGSQGCAPGRDGGDRGAARGGAMDGQDVSWPAQTLGQVLASRTGEALVTVNGRFSYENLNQKAKRAAGAMQSLGIRRGDHVGILMGNDEHWLSLFYGAALIGAVTVPVNTRFKTAEIDFCLKQADCKRLFYVERFLNIDFGAMVRATG